MCNKHKKSPSNQNLKCKQIQRHTGERKEDKHLLMHGLVEHQLASGKFHFNLVCADHLLLNCSQCSPPPTGFSLNKTASLRILIQLENMLGMSATFSLKISSCSSHSIGEETAANGVVRERSRAVIAALV